GGGTVASRAAWMCRGGLATPLRGSVMFTPKDVSLFNTSSTVASGYFSLSIAHAPDTCAAACEVPEPPATPPPGTEEVMRVPGASRFRIAALLENCGTVSFGARGWLPSLVARTLTAEEMQAGNMIASGEASFPDATTVAIFTDLN